ncbi:4Fe-4S binding protein [Thiocystis violacea]|uniref:4Fe-4S binding protein n=1 Tax=Thiocystis violacea TaxID=13725 RepID=UPI001904050B|nr:4Fe-4S binding protein [Thiocystis violacea]MBK1721069.1 4Fe-4S ferredoxin [Thiocystis violacea]
MSWSWFPISSLVTKSALHRPVTRLYPGERRAAYARTRGHIEFKINDCTFCTICAVKCPTVAIVASKQDKTWAIDYSRCILCGNCVDDCREGCIELKTAPWPPMLAKEVLTFRKDYEGPQPPSGVAVALPVEKPKTS